MLVGSLFEGKIMLVDDVIIVGIVICELMILIEVSGVILVGVLIVLDCQEKGKGELFVIQEVECDYGIKVVLIVMLVDVVVYLQ